MSAPSFGKYVRKQRLVLHANNPAFSLRQVAIGSGLEPSFLSKIERGIAPPPSEPKIRALADALGEDADVLLALAGKVSADLQEVIRKRPALFADLLRQLKDAPDKAVTGMVREARARYGKN